MTKFKKLNASVGEGVTRLLRRGFISFAYEIIAWAWLRNLQRKG